MEEGPETSGQIRRLARRISGGNCVLALGPGAGTDFREPPEVPLTVRLARALSCDARLGAISDLNCEDLRHVTQVLFELDRDSTILQDRVLDFYSAFAGQTTDFHRNIAALPFRLCIITTPDDFLYNAFLKAGKSPRRHFHHFRRPRLATVPEGTVDQPVIYHLYGYTDEPDSLVLTENDLIDFLVSVIRNDPPLPTSIRATLSEKKTTCLFIDWGFKNWYLRVLLQALQFHGHSEVSIALEDTDFFAQSRQHQTTVYFSTSKTIQFRQDSLDDFAAKLRAAYESLSDGGRAVAPEPPPGAPRVFLSYASEDRETVEQLGEKLKSAGIAVWEDQQNLRAGDRWDRALMEVINKKVDYVVVLQTPAMANRVEGYFYREIAEALARQKGMRGEIRFLFPVQSQGGRVLAELEPFHSVNVDTSEGVESLIRSIREDWSRRSQRVAAAP